jgi:hypothetical protein
MKEQEWLACKKRPDMMLAQVKGSANDRKQRLFACACARHFWQLFEEPSKRAVEVSELFADHLATVEQLENAHRNAYGGAQREAWLAFQASFQDGALAAFSIATGPGFFKAARDGNKYAVPWPSWKYRMCNLLRDISGNPFRLAASDASWVTSIVHSLAQASYDNRNLPSGTLDNARLAVLADALEEAGCNNPDILNHCRQPAEHVRGCWVVDLLLGKE